MKTLVARRPKARKIRAADDDYLALIAELPLRPLESASEYKIAQSIMDRLIGRPDVSTGQRDYVAALARFMGEYERQKYPHLFEKVPPLEMLKFLMEQNDMSTSDLGSVVGSRGLASEILNGKRGMSKAVIAKLAKRFCVNASLFLEGA
jgi:HTH-type transcriptional regulator / antitoxin HigA